MIAPQNFTTADMVFRTLDNVAKTLREAPCLDDIRAYLQEAIDAARSWERHLNTHNDTHNPRSEAKSG